MKHGGGRSPLPPPPLLAARPATLSGATPSSFSPGGAFCDVAALLLVCAAHLHGAPAPAAVPAGVQKDPVATGAKLEPVQVPGCQEPRGRVRNRPQHPGQVPPILPFPTEAP